MELKVWVEGIQRIVCGVTESTTCHDVVFALAHATGKSGRFTLIERWRCNERLLAPHEHPLKILSKWGEYSTDVQFILQRSKSNAQESPPLALSGESSSKSSKVSNTSPLSSSPTNSTICVDSPEKFGDKTLSTKSPTSPTRKKEPNGSIPAAPPYKDPPNPHVNAPPPYRDPPPPHVQNNLVDFSTYTGKKLSMSPLSPTLGVGGGKSYNSQYKELIQLVNNQREKISSQQADLSKFDNEIVFWENKQREQQNCMEFITQELIKFNKINRINSEKIVALTYIEEEYEIVRQQEKTLKSEITLLRSKLANCETELLQCKNKIRLLMDDIVHEKVCQSRLDDSQTQYERNIRTEMERLETELETVNGHFKNKQTTADALKQDIAAMEKAIVEKKQELEKLVNDMKEANLRSLSIASADEIRQLLDGPVKAGSTRKIVGSPRQLENAVPTNKNPHGVWV